VIDLKQAPPSRWTEIFSNAYSQFGEDGILAEIFKRIGTTNRQCFEVGAADGKWFSNSRRLIDDGWRACLIEADEANWPELDKLDGERVTVVHGKAEPTGACSLDEILAKCEFDLRPDLGVIDVDGQEYYLWNGMTQFRPRVMVVEYEPNVDAAFIPDLNGTGQAGFAAITSVAISKGYFSAAVTPTNAIFVLLTEKERFFKSLEADEAAKVRSVTDFAAEGPATMAATPAPPAPAQASTPVLTTGKEQEIKIAAILSRPRFGLNVFFDCASEALAPWHIPIQSSYGVFWGMTMERMMEENIATGIDWILTLDYDTLFTAKHVQSLIDALARNPDIDAIAALQPRRGKPTPLAVKPDGALPLTGGPVKVRTAHFGLTILRAEAFKKLQKKPWFLDVPAPDGSWGEGRLDGDIYFWGNWGDSGNSLYVHTGCCVGHIEEMASEFTPDGKHRHVYLSDWRRANGHQIKNFE
jgi:hypothetical protein